MDKKVEKLAQRVLNECLPFETMSGGLPANTFNRILEEVVKSAGFRDEDEESSKRTEVARRIHELIRERREKAS
jgi:hypothetical protein